MEHVFSKGQKVHYVPFANCPPERIENGIIKRLHPEYPACWVVYNCGEDWKNYWKYTGALTYFTELRPGWLND